MKEYKLGLLGEKLGHSYSPAIHAALGTPGYALFEVPPGGVEDFLRRGEFDGLNVTIPYKKTVIPFCHTLTEQARRIGSVNTLIRREDGTLLGHNTDYDGFVYMLGRLGAEIRGKKCLILGTGGASLTVDTVLRDLGAGETVFISRTGENHYGNLHRHADARIIVNCTPVGTYPNTGVSPVELSLFPHCEGVLELIYNPARTQLLLEARRRGIPHANGLGMLVAQAKAASEGFRGISIPDTAVEEITARMERESKNLLLVGENPLPAAREVAGRLGRPLTLPGEGEEELALCRESGRVLALQLPAELTQWQADRMGENAAVILLGREEDCPRGLIPDWVLSPGTRGEEILDRLGF